MIHRSHFHYVFFCLPRILKAQQQNTLNLKIQIHALNGEYNTNGDSRAHPLYVQI